MQFENILKKMMRRFDATDANVKDMIGELSCIGQKVDAHAVSIKHLEIQNNKFFTIVTDANPTLFEETLCRILRMMGIAWQSLLEKVSRLLIDLCSS